MRDAHSTTRSRMTSMRANACSIPRICCKPCESTWTRWRSARSASVAGDFVLTVVLYASLDWQFAGQGVDVEGDVRAEQIRQSYRYGGREMDNRLSAEGWQTRMRGQILRLEQQAAVEELYAARLITLAAMALAALEAAFRRLDWQ